MERSAVRVFVLLKRWETETKPPSFSKGEKVLKQEKNQKEKREIFSSIPTTKSPRMQTFWAILACIALPLIIYYPSLHAPFIFDDIGYIVNNPDIKQLNNIKTRLIYRSKYLLPKQNDPSRPLTFLTFTLNYYFGKLDPFGYHLVNIILHVFNVLLVFILMRTILFYSFQRLEIAQDRQPELTLNSQWTSIVLPLIVSLFFASHPMNTEVVTYISHRSDSLATFFYLSSLLFFVKAFEKNRLFYIFSLVCFIFALAAKEIAATLPLILLIFDYIFLSYRRIQKLFDKKLYHLSFWFILIAFIAFRYFYIGQVGDPGVETWKNWTAYSYFITQSYVVLNYIKLLIIPLGQSVDHFIKPAKSLLESRIILSLTLWLVISVVIYRTMRKYPPLSKLILFSSLYFLVALTPTSSIFPIDDAMAERRVYLPALGFSLTIVCLFQLMWMAVIHNGQGLRFQKVLSFFFLVYVFSLSVVTWKRNQLYQNPVLLLEETISRYPDNDRTYNNLGMIYYDHKEYVKALQCYQNAIKLNPKHSLAYNNLGNTYYGLNEYEKALQYYQKAIEINPNFADSYYNVGNLYNGLKEYIKALQYYRKATELNPNSPKAYNNMGTIFAYQKEYVKAQEHFQKAIEFDPNYGIAFFNLGNLYYDLREYKKAIQQYEIAAKLLPNVQLIQERIIATKKLIEDILK